MLLVWQLPLGGMDKIRNHLVAKPIHRSEQEVIRNGISAE